MKICQEVVQKRNTSRLLIKNSVLGKNMFLQCSLACVLSAKIMMSLDLTKSDIKKLRKTKLMVLFEHLGTVFLAKILHVLT